MSNWYVYSGATGAGTGADWTNAKTTLAAAATAAAAGDDIWVASDHAESDSTAQTITFPGTSGSPNRCMSVSRAGSVPPAGADVTAGATVTTTGNVGIIINGTVYVYGITFNVGTGTTSAGISLAASAGNAQTYDTCAINIVNTGSSGNGIVAGVPTSLLRLINTTVSFGSATKTLSVSCDFYWTNKPGSTAVTGTAPTTLIYATTTSLVNIVLDGLDLSAFGSGKTLTVAGAAVNAILTNCKLAGSVTVAGSPTSVASGGTWLIGCNSTTNVERNEIYAYQGTQTTETTVVRTAGASDGTTAYSWKIVSLGNTMRIFPFETFEGVIWNTVTGSSRTLTFHCVTDNVTLTNADIWVEAKYLGASGAPVVSLVSSAPANQLTAGSNLATESGVWTTTGLTTPIQQKFSVSFTPQMVGPIRWKVRIAKPSTTIYVDPNPDLV